LAIVTIRDQNFLSAGSVMYSVCTSAINCWPHFIMLVLFTKWHFSFYSL